MLTTDDVCPRPLLEVAPDEAGGIWLNFNPSERLLKETKGVSVYKPMPSANRKQLGCWATQ